VPTKVCEQKFTIVQDFDLLPHQCTATNCSEQTVALCWGFDSIFHIDCAIHCSTNYTADNASLSKSRNKQMR